MDIKKYFDRVKFSGTARPDFETLKQLHIQHLLNIPFENLDIHLGRRIILEPKLLFDKIVEKKRGGFCYEMNGLFYEVLSAIGFKAKRVSARVFDKPEPGPEFDHMAIIVNINGEEWLADVGFGDSFLEPLRFELDLEQLQFGRKYKIVKLDTENYKLVCLIEGKPFSNMYRFSLIPRELKDYAGMCEFHQDSPDSHFTRNKICSLAGTDGRVSLSGEKLIETKNGVKTETALKNNEDFNAKLNEFFGMEL